MSWVLWQHPEHGEALRIHYRKLYNKDTDDEVDDERNEVDPFEKDGDGDGNGNGNGDGGGDGNGDGDGGGDGDGDGDDSHLGQLLHRKFRLAQAYFEKLTDEEKEQLRDQRECDFEERREAFRKSLKGETECSPDKLAERHHTEVISQRTLETLCAQMKCKGLLILGEIVEGDDDEVFLSMYARLAGFPSECSTPSGSRQVLSPSTPGIHFAKWAPMRSKSMLQTFADFLVASKKDEKGLLGSLLDPGPPATAASTAPALCSQCLGGLTRLDSQPPPDAPSVASKARKTAGKKKRAAKEKSTGGRKSTGKRKRKDQEEEEEVADSGTEEEEDGWRASGEDTEDQEDELESSTRATLHRWYCRGDGLAGPTCTAGPEPENALSPEPTGTSPEGTVANGMQAPPPERNTDTTMTPPEPEETTSAITHAATQAPLADGGMALEPESTASLPVSAAAQAPPSNSSTTTTSPAPETALLCGLKKHDVVLALFRSVDIPEWTAVVNAWGALEKAVSDACCAVYVAAALRLSAANLGSDDEKEDFYEEVMKWWLEVNPAWRKEGLANTSAPDFAVQGLKQEAGGDLGSLPPGLNGLTSIVTCLWWWYRLAGVVEGAPAWRTMAEDIAWVLGENVRALTGKRAACFSSETPSSKRARVG
ncbi:hypothetical protein B0H14DRAFT_2650965 [Mycena olivaceomarginata]|nr:hypothetical protein B0H14DRAFT_2650965 [Mycena olivaceomarginata]